MKTGSHLKIKPMGDKVLGVELKGCKSKPEPIHFRVTFPGGHVDVVRTTGGEYWAHIGVNHRNSSNYDPLRSSGELVDGRMDLTNKSINETDMGDIQNPELYHLAIKVNKLD